MEPVLSPWSLYSRPSSHEAARALMRSPEVARDCSRSHEPAARRGRRPRCSHCSGRARAPRRPAACGRRQGGVGDTSRRGRRGRRAAPLVELVLDRRGRPPLHLGPTRRLGGAIRMHWAQRLAAPMPQPEQPQQSGLQLVEEKAYTSVRCRQARPGGAGVRELPTDTRSQNKVVMMVS